jgi:hypothetical protein
MKKELYKKICDDIINHLQSREGTDLSDIGNYIGISVSMNTCKDQKDMNIWAFEKDDFIGGFEHGYSLNDGTH